MNPTGVVPPSDRSPVAGTSRTSRPGRTFRAFALAAATWAVAFSLVHVYWLAGGGLGLPAGRSVWENPALLVIDVLAVPGLLVVGALMLTIRRAARPSRQLLAVCGFISAALTVHFLPAVPHWWQLAGSASAARLDSVDRYSYLLYEPWFAAGAVLVSITTVLAARRARQDSPSTPRAERSGSVEDLDLVPHV